MKGLVLILFMMAGVGAVHGEETLEFGRFGTLSLYRGKAPAREVVLFVSGDGGWNLGVISMAQHLAAQGVIVAGIDIRHYLQELESSADACVSPASDLGDLARYLQSKIGLTSYLQPTLVGYSSGATLVYAALSEAPEGQFKGALSLGFCPDLDLKKPLCEGSGVATEPRDPKGELPGVNLLPSKSLPGKWISLQGELDQVCAAAPTQKFVKSVPGAELVLLPKVGHGYGVEKRWVPQFDKAFRRIVTPAGSAPRSPLADLPLTIVPASPAGTGPWFGIFLSGDGGWAGFDRGISKELARHDIPIVGWDSLKYFWAPRTPDGASHDLDRVVRFYSQAWGRKRVLLIGFSEGADTTPFMVNRLPEDTHSMVGFTTLMGLSDNALFQFHVANWLGDTHGGIPTGPELRRWSGAPYLCLAGASDADAACEQLTGEGGEALTLPGDHHLGNHYAQIASEILKRLPGL